MKLVADKIMRLKGFDIKYVENPESIGFCETPFRNICYLELHNGVVVDTIWSLLTEEEVSFQQFNNIVILTGFTNQMRWHSESNKNEKALELEYYTNFSRK